MSPQKEDLKSIPTSLSQDSAWEEIGRAVNLGCSIPSLESDVLHLGRARILRGFERIILPQEAFSLD